MWKFYVISYPNNCSPCGVDVFGVEIVQIPLWILEKIFKLGRQGRGRFEGWKKKITGDGKSTGTVTYSVLRIDALVLEAAFNQMEEEVRHFKLARAMARMFSLDIGEELKRAGAEFRSSDYLANLTQPALGRGRLPDCHGCYSSKLKIKIWLITDGR